MSGPCVELAAIAHDHYSLAEEAMMRTSFRAVTQELR